MRNPKARQFETNILSVFALIRITMPGAAGFLRIDGWPSDVRFGVETAIGIEDSLFLAWNTRFSVSEISEIPDKIVNIFVEAAGVYGLKIQPLF